jgi:hypothetical protein
MSRYLLWGLFTCVLASQAASREIALSEILSTGGQKELQKVSSGRRFVDGKLQVESHGSAMEKLERRPDGSSNAILVDATNISDAVNATARVLAGFRSANTPVPADYKLSRTNWLVVYLGFAQSSPHELDRGKCVGR